MFLHNKDQSILDEIQYVPGLFRELKIVVDENRDQSGVEIDFLIEQKGIIYLVEAKASEKINKKELNFKKVVPLLNKYSVKCILAPKYCRERKDYLG